jgi:phage-related minor tail protein
MIGVFVSGALIFLGYILANILSGSTSLTLFQSADVAISYSDLVTILLTGVTVILAALGTVIAVLAFVGWQTFEKKVHNSSHGIIADALAADGKITQTVKAEVRTIMYSDILPVVGDEEVDEEENDFP